MRADRADVIYDVVVHSLVLASERPREESLLYCVAGVMLVILEPICKNINADTAANNDKHRIHQ